MTEARMQQTPEYKAGTFCWMELTTSDGEAAKKFYTGLFGWTFEDRPIGPGMVYTMLKLDGKDTGALYEDKQKLAQGIPHTGWHMHRWQMLTRVRRRRRNWAERSWLVRLT